MPTTSRPAGLLFVNTVIPRLQQHSTMWAIISPLAVHQAVGLRLIVRWLAAAPTVEVVRLAAAAEGATRRDGVASVVAAGNHAVADLAQSLGHEPDIVSAALSQRPRVRVTLRCSRDESEAMLARFTPQFAAPVIQRVLWGALCLNIPGRQTLYQYLTADDSIDASIIKQARELTEDPNVSDDDLTILAGRRPPEWGRKMLWNDRTSARFAVFKSMADARADLFAPRSMPMIVGPEDVVVPDADDEAQAGESQKPS